MMTGYNEIVVDICYIIIIIYHYNNVTDETESSLNENSNQERLTNRASVQTTELLISDNIQERPVEGPRAGMLRAKNCRNLNSKKCRTCSNETYINCCMRTGFNEILVDICKSNIIIHYQNNVTGGEKSSFNRNANPRPMTNRASDATTEPLIPDKKQDMPLEEPLVGMLRAGMG